MRYISDVGAEHRESIPSAARLLLRMLEGLQVGQLELVTPGGHHLLFQGAGRGPEACVHLDDWGVCAAILSRGDVGCAETYMDGRWHTPDLAELLHLALLNEDALHAAIHGRWWSRLLFRLRHLTRANTRRGSQRNIAAHYDIGNDFYALWLDPTMTYSSALFVEGPESLEQAQIAKYERILDRLRVGPDHHVLEIGCGWGGFAAYAAATRGCSVTGLTLSREQLAASRERVALLGLDQRVSFELRDYRDHTGVYDRVVSIEMLEAVGEQYWETYFRLLRERLRPGGGALIQTITMDDAHFARYRGGSDFIQQYIFPGGMLPPPAGLTRLVHEAGLRETDRLSFGQDYARTLRLWRERFDARLADVERLGLDEPFQRLWRFYLAYCEAGFRHGRTDVMQLEVWRD
ncbi:MAG: class I SAM-dependent methyltransferase [Ectothiorhodospiraceae bacterium]|nr:class I SAM-dependent methyltransferase [Ectothiorhodospiraceae bacterium]